MNIKQLYIYILNILINIWKSKISKFFGLVILMILISWIIIKIYYLGEALSYNYDLFQRQSLINYSILSQWLGVFVSILSLFVSFGTLFFAYNIYIQFSKQKYKERQIEHILNFIDWLGNTQISLLYLFNGVPSTIRFTILEFLTNDLNESIIELQNSKDSSLNVELTKSNYNACILYCSSNYFNNISIKIQQFIEHPFTPVEITNNRSPIFRNAFIWEENALSLSIIQIIENNDITNIINNKKIDSLLLSKKMMRNKDAITIESYKCALAELLLSLKKWGDLPINKVEFNFDNRLNSLKFPKSTKENHKLN